MALPLLLGSGCTSFMLDLRESESRLRSGWSGPACEQLIKPPVVETYTTRTMGAGCDVASAFRGIQAQGAAAAMPMRGTLF